MRPSLARFAIPALFALLDLFLVNVAFIVAYWLRYTLEIGSEVPEASFVTLSEYLPVQILLSVVILAALAGTGLYRRPTRTGFVDELPGLLSATSIGMMLVLAAIFLFQRYAWSRLLFVMVWGLSLGLLALARFIKRRIVVAMHKRGIGVQRAIVAGSNPMGIMVMHLMTTDPGLGYELLGYASDDEEIDLGRFRRLGPLSAIPSLVDNLAVDEVIIALPPAAHHLAIEIADHCNRQNLSFKIVPDMYEMSLRQVNVDDLRGVPLIGIKEPTIAGFDRLLKRLLDVGVALAVMVGLSPLWLLIALAIKVDSPGPVLFRQVRVGRDGRLFRVFKFRSMRQGSEVAREDLQDQNEATGPIFKIKADPRRTRVGALLRRLSLDEIPQFLNVLIGDMSAVGPRPLIPSEADGDDEWRRKRMQVQPGVTGLWQVSGRSDLSFAEMVLLDIYYIENWSIATDVKILLRTIPAVLTGRGAY